MGNVYRERWHKKLSVMTWILETMKAEEPYLCNPFPTCLNTNQSQIEPLTAYHAYEDGIHTLRQWGNFEVSLSFPLTLKVFLFVFIY